LYHFIEDIAHTGYRRFEVLFVPMYLLFTIPSLRIQIQVACKDVYLSHLQSHFVVT